MSYTAIVPARSGSKRLPHKNIKLLGGKPLLVWTLSACVESARTEAVILSTDSMEYWKIAQEHVRSDKLVLDYRNPDEAGDNVKIFDYLKGSQTKVFGNRKGAFILALPTVPLRRSRHIDEAIAQFERQGVPVFSATNYGFPISFAFHLKADGGWSPVFEDSPMVTGNTRSQNQKEAYHPNGAIYVRAINDLGRPELTTLYQGAEPYLMDRAASVDIDSEIDFVLAEAFL
jgi:CMP-N,N'-diacetyllegionaminic acid synthase